MANKIVRMRVHEIASRMQTRDALLTPPTPAELVANANRVAAMMALDLGKIWDGIWQTPNAAAAFDALPGDIQGKLLEKYGAKAQQLADYAKASGASSPLTSVTTITDRRATAHDGASCAAATRGLMRDINQRNSDFWQGRGRDASARPRDATQAQVQSINRANAQFWGERNGTR
jgi:hypothetical protein